MSGAILTGCKTQIKSRKCFSLMLILKKCLIKTFLLSEYPQLDATENGTFILQLSSRLRVSILGSGKCCFIEIDHESLLCPFSFYY